MLKPEKLLGKMRTSAETPFYGYTGGLPLDVSDNPEEVFYTTDERLESITFLSEPIRGKDVYDLDPVVRHINNEVRFPRQRLPLDMYRKFMSQINSHLPPCSNEKRGHEFKHKRVRVDRSTSQKLSGKPTELLTSECMYCKQNWSGLRYPLAEK